MKLYRNQLLIDFNQRSKDTEKGATIGLYYQSIEYAVEFNLIAVNNDRGVD